jgi:PAS domain S-box-containing protein
MKINLTLSFKTLIQLVAIPLAIELSFLGAVSVLVKRAELATMAEGHACDVTTHANALLRLMVEVGATGVIYHLSQSAGYHPKYQALSDQIEKESLAIEDLVKNSPPERESYQKMRLLNDECMSRLKSAQNFLSQGDTAGAMKAFAEMQAESARLFEATDQLIAQQAVIQKTGGEVEQDYLEKLNLLLLIGTTFSIIVVCLVATSFNRSTSSRLGVLIDNTMRLASRRPLNPQLGGTDEIAQLDKFFRVMALSLEESVRKETAAVNNALDVICTIDGEGKIAAINPSSLKIFGYGPEDMLGTRISQIVYREDVAQTLENISQAIGQKAVQTFENRIVRCNGTLADISWSVYWSPDEKSWFCMASDITERKEMDRIKREFIALVSDDLKAPLIAINDALSRLGARGHLAGEGDNKVRVAEDNVKRLIGLVNNLLDIEQMESGKLELHIAPASVSAIIERSVRSIQGFAQQSGVRIDVQSGSDVTIQADEEKLVQVVVNLLSNAIKFSPKEASVAVIVQDESDWLKVMVKDEGRGVPDDLKEAIFERFKQVDAADERVKGGSGLGLAICKAIVEQHGGSIGVESNMVNGEKIGSNFWFRVPRKLTL